MIASGTALRPLVVAAGRGERLRPLTLTVPKPLVPVCGRPIVEPLIEWLVGWGLAEIAINRHWLADVLLARLGDGAALGARLVWRHEEKLLAGAGTLKSFEDWLGESTALVINGDCLLEANLPAALAAHHAQGNVLTLVVSPRLGPLARPVAWDEEGRLRGIRRWGLDDPRGRFRGEFTGLHLVEPEVWRRYIPRGVPCDLVGEVIPRLLERGLPVGVCVDEGLFCDVGDAEGLARAHLLVLDRRPARYLSAAEEIGFGVWGEPACRVDGDLQPPVYLGRGSVVERGARLGPYAVLAPGSRLPAGACLSYGVR